MFCRCVTFSGVRTRKYARYTVVQQLTPKGQGVIVATYILFSITEMNNFESDAKQWCISVSTRQDSAPAGNVEVFIFPRKPVVPDSVGNLEHLLTVRS